MDASVPPAVPEAAPPAPVEEPASRSELVPQAPLPTLEDAQRLTAQSDFKPFVAQGVAKEVRNAAMKKLFTDPHFNVMDRLDTYIDDYSVSDPIPVAMLRQMASAKFLNLFDDEEKTDVAAQLPLRDDADTAGVQSVSESTPRKPDLTAADDALAPDGAAAPEPRHTMADHDNTDLRLQQDNAVGPQGPGHGAA